MRAKEFVTEHVLNLITPAQKAKHADEVWDILQNAYAKIGGFKSAASPEELIDDSGIWKLVTRDGHISAVGIYKDKFGRKSIASGTDGTTQGRRDFGMIKDEDVKMGRSWAEVSDAVERIMARSGAEPIPAKFAGMLTGKEILDIDPDGYHYTRLIAGHPHTKIIYGTVHLSPEEKRTLEALGIELHDLPHKAG